MEIASAQKLKLQLGRQPKRWLIQTFRQQKLNFRFLTGCQKLEGSISLCVGNWVSHYKYIPLPTWTLLSLTLLRWACIRGCFCYFCFSVAVFSLKFSPLIPPPPTLPLPPLWLVQQYALAVAEKFRLTQNSMNNFQLLHYTYQIIKDDVQLQANKI